MTKYTNDNLADTASETIPDVQGSEDTRRLPINRVGIKDIRHPITMQMRNQQPMASIAEFDMYVHLPAHLKGTHMSRFVHLLNEHSETFNTTVFETVVTEMLERLEAEVGYLQMRLPYFVKKQAPVSGVSSYMDYQVTLTGEIKNGKTTLSQKIIVPVTSLCPCSKKISDYGAHNQRSHVTITIRGEHSVHIEDIIDLVENTASCELYALLKRPDEKYVTEKAYDNPKFVEDVVRDIAGQLMDDKRIHYFSVESENFESIHNHSAYAMIEYDKTNN